MHSCVKVSKAVKGSLKSCVWSPGTAVEESILPVGVLLAWCKYFGDCRASQRTLECWHPGKLITCSLPHLIFQVVILIVWVGCNVAKQKEWLAFWDWKEEKKKNNPKLYFCWRLFTFTVFIFKLAVELLSCENLWNRILQEKKPSTIKTK